MTHFDLFHYNSLETLFIMESPHIDELKNMIPCSGESGIRMAEKLYGNETRSLGEIIQNNIGCPYGIINTFQFPLGIKKGLSNEMIMYSKLKELRWSPTKTRITFYQEHFELLKNRDLLEQNTKLILRLSEIIEKAKKIKSIVICGYIAQSVFCLLFNKEILPYNKTIALKTKSGKKVNFLFTNHPSTKNNQWDFNMNLLA